MIFKPKNLEKRDSEMSLKCVEKIHSCEKFLENESFLKNLDNFYFCLRFVADKTYRRTDFLSTEELLKLEKIVELCSSKDYLNDICHINVGKIKEAISKKLSDPNILSVHSDPKQFSKAIINLIKERKHPYAFYNEDEILLFCLETYLSHYLIEGKSEDDLNQEDYEEEHLHCELMTSYAIFNALFENFCSFEEYANGGTVHQGFKPMNRLFNAQNIAIGHLKKRKRKNVPKIMSEKHFENSDRVKILSGFGLSQMAVESLKYNSFYILNERIL